MHWATHLFFTVFHENRAQVLCSVALLRDYSDSLSASTPASMHHMNRINVLLMAMKVTVANFCICGYHCRLLWMDEGHSLLLSGHDC